MHGTGGTQSQGCPASRRMISIEWDPCRQRSCSVPIRARLCKSVSRGQKSAERLKILEESGFAGPQVYSPATSDKRSPSAATSPADEPCLPQATAEPLEWCDLAPKLEIRSTLMYSNLDDFGSPISWSSSRWQRLRRFPEGGIPRSFSFSTPAYSSQKGVCNCFRPPCSCKPQACWRHQCLYMSVCLGWGLGSKLRRWLTKVRSQKTFRYLQMVSSRQRGRDCTRRAEHRPSLQ